MEGGLSKLRILVQLTDLMFLSLFLSAVSSVSTAGGGPMEIGLSVMPAPKQRYMNTGVYSVLVPHTAHN